MIKEGVGEKRGWWVLLRKRSNLPVNADIDEPLVVGRIQILCCNFAALLERRECVVAKRVVERVEPSSDIGRELGGVHIPIDDFGIGVAKSAGGSRRRGCVKCSIVVGVERCQCWTN